MSLDKPAIGAACNACGLCCRITVCSSGSYALGLVETFGERAPGPCPALLQNGQRQECGVMRRPHDWLHASKSVTAMREAFGVLIGAGAGCDEAGDEPEETARPKINAMLDRYLRDHGHKIESAAMLIFAARKVRENPE